MGSGVFGIVVGVTIGSTGVDIRGIIFVGDSIRKIEFVVDGNRGVSPKIFPGARKAGTVLKKDYS